MKTFFWCVAGVAAAYYGFVNEPLFSGFLVVIWLVISIRESIRQTIREELRRRGE